MLWPSAFPTKKLKSLLSELFSYKVLKNSLIKQNFCTETTEVSLL